MGVYQGKYNFHEVNDTKFEKNENYHVKNTEEIKFAFNNDFSIQNVMSQCSNYRMLFFDIICNIIFANPDNKRYDIKEIASRKIHHNSIF